MAGCGASPGDDWWSRWDRQCNSKSRGIFERFDNTVQISCNENDAKQAEAERNRRAKVIHAEGELQASEKLLEAAQTLSKEPQALQLRYLQTLNNIADEKNSTIVFPIPLEFLGAFKQSLSKFLNKNNKDT